MVSIEHAPIDCYRTVPIDFYCSAIEQAAVPIGSYCSGPEIEDTCPGVVDRKRSLTTCGDWFRGAAARYTRTVVRYGLDAACNVEALARTRS